MAADPTPEEFAAFRARCDERRARDGLPPHITSPAVYRILDGFLVASSASTPAR